MHFQPICIECNGRTHPIPPEKRDETMKMILQNPQDILSKGDTVWEVQGTPPVRGGDYKKFSGQVREALAYIPEEDRPFPISQVKSNPRVKAMYDRTFKNNPDLINPSSVTNAVASNLLDYDQSSGMARGSIAEARMRRNISAASIPLQTAMEPKFDRIVINTFGKLLVDHKIPEAFLQSSHFSARPQLHQVYQEDEPGLRGRMENTRDTLEFQILKDYATLVNQINQFHLSRYPFQQIAAAANLNALPNHSRSNVKLAAIRTQLLAIPGSADKYSGIGDMINAYTRTKEAKLINAEQFMLGLKEYMADDATFIKSVFKNRQVASNTRSPYYRTLAILKGKSLVY